MADEDRIGPVECAEHEVDVGRDVRERAVGRGLGQPRTTVAAIVQVQHVRVARQHRQQIAPDVAIAADAIAEEHLGSWLGRGGVGGRGTVAAIGEAGAVGHADLAQLRG